MEIRRAVLTDVDALTENRMEFLATFTKSFPPDFSGTTRAYLTRHLNDGSLVAYLAADGETIAASAILCIYETIPTPANPGGRHGYLYNVYTRPAYRRQGLSTAVLQRLMEEAELAQLDKIVLDYMPDGLRLYQKLGFCFPDRHMELSLPRTETAVSFGNPA